jgi:hypothetical protein
MNKPDLKERTRREVAEYAEPLSIFTVEDESGMHTPFFAFAAHPERPREFSKQFKSYDEAAAYARGFYAGFRHSQEFGGAK